MKPSIATTVAIAAVLLGVGGGAGYWIASESPSMKEPAPQMESAKSERKLLYYRNPMGLPDTSPVPKKDSMGMDYLPVYSGDEPEEGKTGQVKISVAKVQKLGVRTEVATMRELSHVVRAVGTFQADERKLHTISPKFEGWIERLHVNTTGQTVARGQALMEVYSPDLVSAQSEYLIALRGLQATAKDSQEVASGTQGIQRLADSSLTRLRNLDIAEQDLQRLQGKEGTPSRLLTLRSPVNGIILEKIAVQGMRFMPGEVLYKIADLSSLWLIAEVFEQDVALVRPGQAVNISVSAYPGRVFSGKVAFIQPTLNMQTRTAQVRIELPNPGGLLKPAMYANVELAAAQDKLKVLTVPVSSVIHSGKRDVALVELSEGLYEPREVKLGVRSDNYVEILSGITENEKVVVSANFLIDAESNLKAALQSFSMESK